MTTEEFSVRVDEWMKTAQHPRFGRRYDECIYQPMHELLAYLRASGFKTYIVSGGGADFMRVWSERVYGVLPEQVVGSHGAVKFEMREGEPVLVKTMDTVFVDDKEGKPAGIHQYLGRRPVMAFGNSDGGEACEGRAQREGPVRARAGRGWASSRRGRVRAVGHRPREAGWEPEKIANTIFGTAVYMARTPWNGRSAWLARS